jgi:hypothetical protein
MKPNESDVTRGNSNKLSSSAAIQEIHVGGEAALTINEEEVCGYLVTDQFPLTDDRKYEFQQDHRWG